MSSRTPDAKERPLSPEAKRALAEAQARREKAQANQPTLSPEKNCSRSIEPTRFGDWEKKGIAYDF